MGFGEGVGGCQACIKYLLFAFNFLFWLMGCGLVGIGIWVLVDPNFKEFADKEGLELLKYAGIALLVIGGIIMFVGFFGCCGAIRESPCLLVTFFVCLTLLFLVLSGLGVWILVRRLSFVDHVSAILEKYTRRYYDIKASSSERMLVDWVQAGLLCCGAYDPVAEFGLSNLIDINKVPPSCITDLERRVRELDDGMGIACSAKLDHAIQVHAGIIACTSTAFFALMIMGMTLSLMLSCTIRRNADPALSRRNRRRK